VRKGKQAVALKNIDIQRTDHPIKPARATQSAGRRRTLEMAPPDIGILGKSLAAEFSNICGAGNRRIGVGRHYIPPASAAEPKNLDGSQRLTVWLIQIFHWLSPEFSGYHSKDSPICLH
jgi:hypothetical protein